MDTAVLAASQRQPTLSMLFSGDLQLFLSPDAVDAFPVHPPTVGNQFLVDPWHTIAGMHARELTHLRQQSLTLCIWLRLIPLRTARLSQHPANTALRHAIGPQATTDFLDRSTAPLGAYQFPFAASVRISMSRA